MARAGLVVALALGAAACSSPSDSTASSKAGHPPVVLSLRFDPTTLTAKGGTVTATADVEYATHCAIIYVAGTSEEHPSYLPCSNGSFSGYLTFHRNYSSSPKRSLVGIVIYGPGGTTRSGTTAVTVLNAAPVVSVFSVPNPDVSSAGGTVAVNVAVKTGYRCSLITDAGLKHAVVRFRCPHRVRTESAVFPANPAPVERKVGLRLAVYGDHNTHTVQSVMLEQAAGRSPGVTSFTISPTRLPDSGGKLVLAVSAQATRWCIFSVLPHVNGLPRRFHCQSGNATTTVTLPANPRSEPRRFEFELRAETLNRTIHAAPVVVTEAGSPPAVSSFEAERTTVPASGDTVVLHVHARRARTCTVSVTPGLAGYPEKKDCFSGFAEFHVALPPNKLTTSVSYSFSLSVEGPSGPGGAGPVVVVEQGASATTTTTTAPKSTTTTAHADATAASPAASDRPPDRAVQALRSRATG